MTCNEFRSHVAGPGASALPLPNEPSEHLAICAHCRAFFEGRQELQRQLQLIRDSAPQIPASLDAKVLGKYHEQIALARARSGQPRRTIVPLMVSWKSALVTAALVFIAWGFVGRRHMQPPMPDQAQMIVESAKPQNTSSPADTYGARVTTQKRKRRPNHARPAAAVPVAAASASLAAGFRGLMVCDALSCPETLEVIRVQLPPSFAGFASTSTTENGVVLADVLVGPDGIARGIRIVE